MKKRKSLVCLIIALLMACSTVFVGCGGQSVKADNYLENIKVKQESQTVETEDGEKTIESKFVSKEVVGGYMFLQYKIGTINNCFIQTLTTPVRGAKSIKYETGKMSSDTITNGIASYISTTKSISTTESNSNKIEWNFSASNTSEVSATVGVNVGVSAFGVSAGASEEAGVKDSYTVAAGMGGENTNETSQTIGEVATKETHKNIDVTKMEQQFTNVSYEFDLSEYDKGYFYALCLMMDLEVYQIIAYDVQTEEFYTSYFMTKMIGVPAMDMLSSEDKVFGISADYQLSPITKINVEEIENFTPEKPSVTGWQKFSENMTKYNCDVNTFWDKTTQGHEVWDRLHKDWELGDLNFYGLEKIGDNFKIKEKEALSIKYKLLQNTSKLPTNNEVTSQVLAYLGWNQVVGTNISTVVGYGAYWVRVTYLDDTQIEKNATNFLNKKNQGEFIELLSAKDVDPGKTIEKVEVVVVYCTAAGFSKGGLWRCEYTCNFN